MTTSFETFLLLAPELVLIVAALVAFLASAFAGLRAGWLVAILGLGLALMISGEQPAAGAAVLSGPVTLDGFSAFMRTLIYAGGLVLCLVQAGDRFRSAVQTDSGGVHRHGSGEEAGTFLILLAGLSLVGLANDLVLLFVGLELVSIPTYILLALKRSDAAGQEASLKYFYLSLIASALFLYAVVCLYGLGGSTSLAAIGSQLRSLGTAPEAGAVVGTITPSMAAVLLPVYARHGSRRCGLPHGSRSNALLRAGCLSGHQPRQRGGPLDPAENCRCCRAGTACCFGDSTAGERSAGGPRR